MSTLKLAYAALDRGEIIEAKRIVEYARLEWQVVHDMYVNWSWAFFTYIAENYGEPELEKAFRSVLGSYYRARYDKAMASSVETQLQLSIEGLRGHLMGPGRQGDIEVTEEPDRYKLTLAPCGSGGVARERVESGAETRPELFGFSKKAHPWTWGKERVCYYCAHCTMVNEVMAIESDRISGQRCFALRLVYLQGPKKNSGEVLRTCGQASAGACTSLERIIVYERSDFTRFHSALRFSFRPA